MKRISARIVAFGMVAVGLFLGTVVLLSVYSEAAGTGMARHVRRDEAVRPHSQRRSIHVSTPGSDTRSSTSMETPQPAGTCSRPAIFFTFRVEFPRRVA